MIQSKFIGLLTFSLLSFTMLHGQSNVVSKIAPSLVQKSVSKAEFEYILVLKSKATFGNDLDNKSKNEKAKHVYSSLVKHAERTQKPIIEFLNKNNISYQSFYITNAIKVTSSFEVLHQLAQRDDIEHVADNAPFKMLDYTVAEETTSQRAIEPEWGIKMIKADSVWQLGYKGKGVVIGGQDTGYDWDVSPIKQKYRGYTDSLHINHNYSWHDAIHKNSPNFADTLLNPCGYSTKEPCDDNNHGTHTMGTMVGEDAGNKIGVAPEATWIACRNMDRGWGQPSTYLECFEWLLAPYDLDGKNADPTKAPHVINNSWYCSDDEGCNTSNYKIMNDVVKNLKKAGIVVVASAGNSGPSCSTIDGPPAFFEETFSVGATGRDDLIASFSSRGVVKVDSSMRIKPNVSAPGVGVRSVIRNGAFASFNGTSMAGPHVAGVVALMISANPLLAGRVDVIEDIIESSAVPKFSTQSCNLDGNLRPNPVYGFGRIDALQAIIKAKTFLSPVATITTSASLVVFPNPTQNEVTFQFLDGEKYIDEIVIFDNTGRNLLSAKYTLTTNIEKLTLSHLNDGIYFYKLLSGNQCLSGKFLILKQ
jgi:subtilisin family serine protease